MAYDEKLAERIRAVLPPDPGITEKHMFGGVAFLIGGNMFCGIAKSNLMLRLPVDQAEAAQKKAHVKPMDFTGRPMKGYVFVEPAGMATKAKLAEWIAASLRFGKTFPVKPAKPKKTLKETTRRR